MIALLDHLGGLVSGTQPVFPTAVVRMDRRDADYWLDDSRAASAPKDQQPVFQAAKAALQP